MRNAILLALALVAGVADAASFNTLRASVFKIQVASSEPNFVDPWKKQHATQSSGTGFYIGDDRIMTNAHVVANATYVAVLRDGDSRPIPATVKFIAHDSDLAILEVSDKKIFDDLEPMRFGPLPKLRSPVSTIGFPTGGEQVSITEGVVSRVSYRGYVHHGAASHILVQVDSAINPGNSGGPVVQGRLVIGVAFQTYTRAENTGYIIPTVVVNRFLKDVEDGTYDGHPEDGLVTNEWYMLNPSAAAFHGLKPEDGGVKIASVAPWAPTAAALKEGDIILAVDGSAVGVDGKVSFQGERVDFRTLFDLKQIGDTIRFKIARESKVQEVTLTVAKSRPHHESRNVYEKHARFVVHGGLVFTALTRSYLKTWGERWFRDAPLLLRFLNSYSQYEPEFNVMRDVVVLAKRLPDDVNTYVSGNIYGVVSEVNGRKITSLDELPSALGAGSGEFIVVKFFGSDDPLVLDRARINAANAAINERYGVFPDRWLHGPEDDGALRTEASSK